MIQDPWHSPLGGGLVFILDFGSFGSRLTLVLGTQMANVTLDALHLSREKKMSLRPRKSWLAHGRNGH